MIKKLRRKIVAINIVSVGIVFFVAILLTTAFGYSFIDRERSSRMEDAFDYDTQDEVSFSDNDLYQDLALVIYNTQTEQAQFFFGNDFSFNHQRLQDNFMRIVNSNLSQGYASVRVRYKKTTSGNEVRIVFNDLNSSQNSITPFLLVGLSMVIVGISFYLAISFMLARIALKPVEESWQKQKQFIADASHELKTPLSVIMANTEIIASHPDDTVQSQSKWIENTREESNRMAELVADLLFLAKNDDGLVVQMDTINLSDAVATTVLSSDSLFYENGKKFDYQLDKEIHIQGNEKQIKQLVTILLDNANKYSTDVGNINLSLKLAPNGKHATLIVSNDSETMSDEQLSHLFDRFYTVDQSRNTRGSGLGLSIAKTIVQTHNGTISVDYNQGRTIFTVVFNVVKNLKNS